MGHLVLRGLSGRHASSGGESRVRHEVNCQVGGQIEGVPYCGAFGAEGGVRQAAGVSQGCTME